MAQPGNANNAGGIGLELEQQPRPKRAYPWFPEFIRLDLRGDVLPNQVIQARNWAIVALGFQIVATIAGFAFFYVRRVTS